MKFMNTYINNLLKLNLIILIYAFALNCSTKDTPPVENPPMPLTNDCLNGETKNAQGLCVPKCNQNQVIESNTCVNTYNITFNLDYPNAEAIQSITKQKAGTTVSLPVPTRTGYIFKGWSFNNVNYNNNFVMPASEVTFTAVWVNASLSDDADSNGLIDIYTLEDLNNVRFNLAGTSWKTSLTDTVWRTGGCPASGCRGYELKTNLDFSGTKWASNYTGTDWVTSGWVAIGDCGADNDCNTTIDNRPFAATFNGNGFEIRNLYINKSNQSNVGLFGYAGTSILIKSLGVVNTYVKGKDFVGGLLGYQQAGSIINSYASGSVSGSNNIGGLVGYQQAGSVTNSYVSGSVSGSTRTGGLVGESIGSITNSYTSGSVSGVNQTGGLVGFQSGGSITNSYASGSVSGTNNYTGGLVGSKGGNSNITNSYTSGSVSGVNYTGGLMGRQNGGSISNSYTSGSVSGGNYNGGLVGELIGGNITNSYFVSNKGNNGIGEFNGSPCPNSSCIKLNIADILTLNSPSLKSSFINLNWDANSRAGNGHPALLGTDGMRLSGQGTIPNFDTVIIFKQNDNSEYTKLLFGNKGSVFNFPSTSKDAGIILDGVTLLGWSTKSPTNNVSDNNNLFTSNIMYSIPSSTLISLTFYPVFNVTEIPQIAGEDGLIWISNAVALYNIRYSLNGTYYQNGPNGYKNTRGCPVSGCRGYKLLNNIDFNTDSTAVNWASITNIGVANGGWEPIGDCGFSNVCRDEDDRPFVATFDGKGFEIRNLYINKPSQVSVGLFGYISGTSTLINSLGVVNVYIKGNEYTGGLVGYQQGSNITNSYASGTVSGANNTGGLVGSGSNITNSYASGLVSGANYTGGLVGYGSNITNSYASGLVSGNQYTGGLVGSGGSITNSYASGLVSGNQYTGGLVGSGGSITNSYASCSVSGTSDNTGGLVGLQNEFISNSYASGSVRGNQFTGGLVGQKSAGNLTNTYWNSMSDQTIAGVSRSEAQKLGIGNVSTSTSSSTANGLSALSTNQLQSNVNDLNATILATGAFYSTGNSFPKLCYTPLPSGVSCSAAYRIPGQD